MIDKKHDTRSNAREVSDIDKSNQDTGKLCSKSHGIWICSEFKAMEISKRWEYAKN